MPGGRPGPLAGVASPRPGRPGFLSFQSVADFTGEGKADLLWWNTGRGEVWVWLMDGTTKVSETWVATVAEIGYQIIK